MKPNLLTCPRTKKVTTRPPLPMTLRQHERTRDASRDRCMEIENKLVAKTRHDPIGGLAKLAAFAAEALRQMELTLKALPEGADPFLWPIFPEERELVAELQQRYPADADILVSVLDLFHQLSDRVTVDELAVGAIKGLKWKALVAGALEGSHER